VSSFVSLSPQSLVAASQDLTGIGSAIRSANAAAAMTTTQVAAAGQDEVSAAIAGVFGSYAQVYRALIAQAGLFHDQFVQALGTGAGAYAATEAANESPLETVEAAISQEAGIAQRTVGRDARIAQRAIAADEQMVQGS
jgi:uncharacterized 2Fe-2S/4Fe-4S cluster protein (DUF4445 family)